MVRALLNRPLLASDLDELRSNAWAGKTRELVARYRAEGLPVMNGGFAYSNLLEGRAQAMTCIPYRLWEYSSLFLELPERRDDELLLDIGGAGAPLAYLLAESGRRVLTIDLQPVLVALAQHAASVRSLPLQAKVADVTKDLGELEGSVSVVTFVSVLEHVPVAARRAIFDAVARLLQPRGLFYMTFDYGHYEEVDGYVQERSTSHASRSVEDVRALSDDLERAGFRFRGNDPRELPADVLALTTSPVARQARWSRAVTTQPFDAETPWSEVAKYVVKRLFRYTRARRSRFDRHNFFRMFLEKA
jgi:SAM-dependent methyltransferase